MQLQALTLPLYPALLYRRGLLDRLLLRAPRIAVNPLGRLQTSTDATLKITGFAEGMTMDLQGGFSLQLSAEPRGSISELSLRIRPAGLSSRARDELNLQTVVPAASLRSLALPAMQTRAPYLTASSFSRLWHWLRHAAAACNAPLPALELDPDGYGPLESPPPDVSCIACQSVNVLGGKDAWRCLDCGYESDGLVNARKEQELVQTLERMSSGERDEAALALLTDMRSRLIAVQPDCVQVIEHGDNKSGPSVRNRALHALGVLHQLKLDADLVTRYRPDTLHLAAMREELVHAPELDLSDPKRDLAERILRRLNDVLDAWPGRADQSEPWE